MNSFIKAARHILRTRMIKQAYGYADDYAEFDWMADSPYDLTPDASTKEIIKALEARLANLRKDKVSFSDAPPYQGIPMDMALSKYKYHINDNDEIEELPVDDYITQSEKAIKTKDRKALEDLASYMYYSKVIPESARTRDLKKALRKFDWNAWFNERGY